MFQTFLRKSKFKKMKDDSNEFGVYMLISKHIYNLNKFTTNL